MIFNQKYKIIIVKVQIKLIKIIILSLIIYLNKILNNIIKVITVI